MKEVLEAFLDPDFSFLRVALLMGFLASFAFGMMGSYVVVKRISYVAGAISHAVLGGIGAALYFERVHGIAWLHPMIGALISALLAALIISWVKYRGFEREDSVIGAVWATGMAIGLIFISLTPGYVDPMSYLFGNILILSSLDVYLVLILDILLIALASLCYSRLQAVCFDEELAALRGISVPFYYTLLLCLIALTIVLLVSVVGVVLVVALLTIPAAIASRWVRSLWSMMILSGLLTFVFISSGLVVSYHQNWPTGPSIILTASGVYLFGKILRRA